MSPATTAAVDRAHLAFALAVHRAIAPDPAKPACWSPLSVASALGLLATGARGQTRDELTALLLGDPRGSLTDHGAMLAAATDLAEPGAAEPPIFGVANTLWTNPGLPITETFGREVLSWPNGAIREAPFQQDAEQARQLINAEVAEVTHDLIRAIVKPGAIDRRTVAALVNALYLKCAWRQPFPEGATAPRPFHRAGGSTELPTMRLTKQLRYAATGGWQVVELPAAGGVDAVVLLPDGDLAAAEAGLDADTLAGLLAAPATERLELYLPKFRLSVSAGLTEALRELGVRRVFTDDADLSGISERRLQVSRVLHQAVLNLDEQGFEGAAATVVLLRMAAMVRAAPPIVVRVDRPFLVLVRHRGSGAIYFLARVTGAD